MGYTPIVKDIIMFLFQAVVIKNSNKLLVDFIGHSGENQNDFLLHLHIKCY
jgi:hypothetical protein